MNKISKKILTGLMAIVSAFTFASCVAENPKVQFQAADGYIQWRYENEELWNNLIAIEELKGETGTAGENGIDGENGKDGQNGQNGKSAYEIAVSQGFSGTETEWLSALKGKDGVNGKSTYEIAVENGFEGTETEWLASLKGADGEKGKDGIDGTNGKDGENGKSAYEIAVSQGFKGTEEEWLISLQGKVGETGKSAYDVAKELGFEGTEAEWLESLKGADGKKGENGKDGVNGTNGKDGYTPFIGENGNWWIHETDTGVSAIEVNMEGKGTDGLHFQAVIREGIAGYEVVGYDGDDNELVIPDKIFDQKVISIKPGALPKSITSVKISKYTEYVPSFKEYANLQTFDFNNAPIESIIDEMFYNTGLRFVKNYNNVTSIGNSAFRNTSIINFDYSNVKEISTYAFYNVNWENLADNDSDLLNVMSTYNIFIYIPDNVTSIGVNAFSDDDLLPVYYEGDGTVDYSGEYFFKNVKHNEDGYYYRDMGGYASLLNYDGKAVDIVVPSILGGKAVTSVEKYAFCWNGNVERIELPSTVSVIAKNAFSCTGKLHSLFIPSSVVTCGEGLAKFPYDIVGAEIVTIFFEATEFDYGAFNSDDLKTNGGKYRYGVKPADVCDDSVCIYEKKLTSCEIVSIKNVKGLVKIPNAVGTIPVTKINSYALYDLDGIHQTYVVEIPASVIRVCTKAFYGSSALKVVNIAKGVEDVNYRGFYNLSNCTIYIADNAISTDWDSEWYYSIKTYKLSSQGTYSQDENYLYETVDGKVYLVKYLKEIKAGETIVVPKTIDGKTVYGVRGYCYQSQVTNSSSNRIKIAVSSSIKVLEQYAFYLGGYYTYVDLYVGYAENEGRPVGWNSSWIYQTNSSSSYRKYYYIDNNSEINDEVGEKYWTDNF